MAKLGKGYRDNKPIGIVAGICDECGGDVIALQMCTSKRGFSVSSEKVCQDCGLLAPQSFILDHPITYESPKQPKYNEEYTSNDESDTIYKWKIDKTKEPYADFKDYIRYKTSTLICPKSYHTLRVYGLHKNIDPQIIEYIYNEECFYKTHKDWYEDNSPTGFTHEGIDDTYEYKLQIAGERPGPHSYNTSYESSNKSTGRLKAAMSRESRVGAMRHTPMKIWVELQYKELIMDYAHEIGMNTIQIEEVEYIMKNRGSDFDTRYKMEDILFCICVAKCIETLDDEDIDYMLTTKLQEHNIDLNTYLLVDSKIW